MKRILCLGDSNTYGYDPRSYGGGRYPEDVRWTGLLQSGEYELINRGQNGLCIPRRRACPALKALLDSLQPLDAAIVMMGGNDLLTGADAAVAAERMETLLLFLRESAPETRLLLIAPPHVQPGEWVPGPEMIEETKRLTREARELAGRLGVDFADADDWGVALSFDGVHFTEEGHAAFARGLQKLLDGWENA